MSELLSDVSNDFKTYHFAIVDQLDDEEVESEQGVELIDRIGELIGKLSQTKTGSGTDLLENPQLSVPAPASTNDRPFR